MQARHAAEEEALMAQLRSGLPAGSGQPSQEPVLAFPTPPATSPTPSVLATDVGKFAFPPAERAVSRTPTSSWTGSLNMEDLNVFDALATAASVSAVSLASSSSSSSSLAPRHANTAASKITPLVHLDSPDLEASEYSSQADPAAVAFLHSSFERLPEPLLEDVLAENRGMYICSQCLLRIHVYIVYIDPQMHQGTWLPPWRLCYLFLAAGLKRSTAL
jgi:hypothetical protein